MNMVDRTIEIDVGVAPTPDQIQSHDTFILTLTPNMPKAAQFDATCQIAAMLKSSSCKKR
jgi:hypothetical protein